MPAATFRIGTAADPEQPDWDAVIEALTAPRKRRGARRVEERDAGLAFGLDVEGRRRESAADDRAVEHRIGLGAGWKLVGADRQDLKLGIEDSRLLPANDNPENRIGIGLTARW